MGRQRRRFAIFKVHSGAGHGEWTDQDVADVVANYRPDVRTAPLVKGHPFDDDPKFGDAVELDIEDGVLYATADVDDDLVEDVRAKRFEKVSAWISREVRPWMERLGLKAPYLKHIGFFGAGDVKLPDLPEAVFADGGDEKEIGAPVEAWPEGGGDMEELMKRLEELAAIVKTQGEQIAALLGAQKPAGAAETPPAAAAATEGGEKKEPVATPPETPAAGTAPAAEGTPAPAGGDAAFGETDRAALLARIARLEGDQARDRAGKLADKLIGEGKITARQKEAVVKLLVARGDGVFSDGDPLAEFLTSLPKIVTYGEVSGGDDGTDAQFGENRAKDYYRANRKAFEGQGVSEEMWLKLHKKVGF